MGYALFDDREALAAGVTRWAGYGVPAVCDHARRCVAAGSRPQSGYQRPDAVTLICGTRS